MITTLLRFISKFKARIVFFVMGTISLIWFLVRVIPKPSRAAYPCMRAAAPFASSLVLYLLGLTSFTLFFKKAKNHFIRSRYAYSAVFLLIGLTGGITAVLNNGFSAKAATFADTQPGNQPIGTGVGIFPGRVVWEHDADATNENCTNTTNNYWYMDANTDQEVVNSMLSSSLQKLTGTTTDSAAWDALFHNFNSTHGKGDVGYQAGEKVSIKINLNGIYNGNRGENINTSPQVCKAVLDQLVNVVGMEQTDITIGDQNCPMNDVTYAAIHSAFPDVICWGNTTGRTVSQPTADARIHAADGSFDDKIPQAYADAAYLINLPVLKKHHRAGISISTKNHFGSLGAYTGGASHLHASLPCADMDGINDNGEYGVYRCFVDIMGHKDLGGKTILFVVDGLWGSINWGHPAVKWEMTPFNNDWPSSLFVSQDQVALESVCFDFLFEEFDEDHPTEGIDVLDGTHGPYPHFEGTDDYLHQAADPANWPGGMTYDPEADGTPLTSLGVHEHWNNASDKQYSRNLSTGQGIELVSPFVVSSLGDFNVIPDGNMLYPSYPNPFTQKAMIMFKLGRTSDVHVSFYNNMGQLVRTISLGSLPEGEHVAEWNATDDHGRLVPSGMYICSVEVSHSSGIFKMTNKVLFINK